MKTVSRQLYLGDWISSDGSNKENISRRISKCQGIIRDILHILNGTCFGEFYFETMITLRKTMFVSVLTNNCETWYNLKTKDLQNLESVDAQLIRQGLMTSSKTSICLMMLDLGLLPIRYILIIKRLMYFHHLITLTDNSLATQVLLKQM